MFVVTVAGRRHVAVEPAGDPRHVREGGWWRSACGEQVPSWYSDSPQAERCPACARAIREVYKVPAIWSQEPL